MRKEIVKISQIKARKEKLETELGKVKRKRRNISLLVKGEDSKVRLILKVKKEIAMKSQQIEKMEKAARFIQEKSREFKNRRLENEYRMEKLQEKIEENAEFLEKTAENIFWNLGNAVVDSANKIKKAYSRAKFRAKIERIRKVYKILSKNKKTLCRIKIRLALRIFTCKLKQKSVLKEKKKKNRLEVLKKIRQNLAILSIKKYWNSNRITFRKFLFRCKKYKRQLQKVLNSRYLSVDFQLSEQGSYLSTPQNEPIEVSKYVVNEEVLRMAALRLQQEKQAKLNASLISYNVKKYKEVNVLPLTLNTVEERVCQVKSFRNRENSVGNSSKTIGYLNHNIGKSIGSLSTRSASNRHRVFRY